MPKKKVVKLKRLDVHSHKDSPMNLITQLVINVVALLVVGYVVPGFFLADFKAAIVAAVVIGVINTYIKPIFQLLALPFTIVTFGIAAFLINVLLLMLSAAIVPGFEIDSFLTAAIASILLTLTSWFLHKLAH
jgi:putative membrane protein